MRVLCALYSRKIFNNTYNNIIIWLGSLFYDTRVYAYCNGGRVVEWVITFCVQTLYGRLKIYKAIE